MRARNTTREITLTFTGMRGNGSMGRLDTYHFAFVYDANTSTNQTVSLVPVNPYCKFDPPLHSLENLSLRFNDPELPIEFNSERIPVVSMNYQSTDGRILVDSSHSIEAGDVIIVENFSTNDDTVNAGVIAKLSDPRGIYVGNVATSGSNTIIITNIDFTQIIAANPDVQPTLFVYSRAFRFPLEIGYQKIENQQ